MSSPRVNNTVVKMNFSPLSEGARTGRAAWEPRSNVAQHPDWHDSERLFFQVFNNHEQPMSITTFAEGRYLEVNPSFLERLGYTNDEVIGHTSLELGIWKNSAQRAE